MSARRYSTLSTLRKRALFESRLFEDPSRLLVTAVEDDVELLGFLHLFEQRFGILGVGGELPDLQADVVSGRSFNELLQADET